MSDYSCKLITVSNGSGWGPGDNFEVSIVLEDKVYFLQGKRIRSTGEIGEKNQTIEKSVKISASWVNEILDELRKANIPLFPEEVRGCDGTFYSMTLGTGYGGATYRWWSCPPDGWEILPEVTWKIIDEFSKHLPK